MALRQVVLAMQMRDLRAQMTNLETTQTELANRRTAMQTREAELEAAVNEVTEETTPEDRQQLDAAVAQYETDNNALTEEESQNTQSRQTLQQQIDAVQVELDEIAARSATQPAANPTNHEERNENRMPTNTRRQFFGMNHQERDAFLARTDVKDFLQRVRGLKGQSRAVTGAELTIPTIVLDLIRENVEGYSKLYKHVNVRYIPGNGRAPAMGTIPEAVWTEMCATLNELELGFYDVEVDGYKVGGYIAVCNAVLEDSDVALATELITAIGQAIGLALDKAVLYGTGTKMPLGIVTRLAQTAAPDNYPTTARPWVNLSETNLLSTSQTGTKLFADLVKMAAAAKGKHSRGAKFWAMNESTHMQLVAEALTFNAAGAVATGMGNTMPLIGGAIEELSFIPDGVIIGGYGDVYLLAERAGAKFGTSEHVRFIEDQTVFKGTARYDGKPAIAEGFVAIGIKGTKPTAGAVTFAEDKANAAS